MHRSVRGPVRLVAFSVAAALAAALSACSSVGGSGSGATATGGSGGSGNMLANAIFGAPNPNTQNAVVLDANTFAKNDKVAACPPVSIRPGTEAYRIFDPGKKPDPITGEQPDTQYLSTIVRTARECRNVDGGVAVKVGVLGRSVAGPAGRAGTLTLPIRIAVVQGNDKILKSDLYRIQVTLTEPDLGTDFTKIDDTIVVPISPGNTDFRIYVGFDESGAGQGRAGRS